MREREKKSYVKYNKERVQNKKKITKRKGSMYAYA